MIEGLDVYENWMLFFPRIAIMIYTFFYRQLDFPSEPGIANEILENEPKSSLAVA